MLLLGWRRMFGVRGRSRSFQWGLLRGCLPVSLDRGDEDGTYVQRHNMGLLSFVLTFFIDM